MKVFCSEYDRPTLLLGEGQLGLVLCQLINEETLIQLNRSQVDFLQPKRLADLVVRLQPKVIINAAAYTSVDQAEVEPELAYQINTQAVAILADAAKQTGALLVHFSTDYVFDGSGDKPWREDDLPEPLNAYGLSKYQGEQAIVASGCRHLILRTTWLHSPYRYNFLKTMLRLGGERSSLSVVCDQVGSPTSAAMLAEATLIAIRQTLVNPALGGLYHVAAVGEVNWYDYASFIFKEGCALGLLGRIPTLIPVTSDHYASPARRPLNSRFDTRLFRQTFGVHFLPWQAGVAETLRQLSAEQ
ncbi:dTDP-4-dehydrorhamnose reductase [Aeromonas caviae]|uniref:dTDP-4-dehydrorhamnose reductase n=1 Tax=Aeromonas caviae TaxID=648 RepID=A0A3S7P7I8_AERCA|nr:dTDP-4-dehydrorhamnose reductase [Aeromonas caviae]AXB06228.1 dTDP-4-dehydrorhamnose reductase [Aeromonas caviae]AXB09036.1 dTDP-4-dehydrorhamnose reductase [Aeromonas caviae]